MNKKMISLNQLNKNELENILNNVNKFKKKKYTNKYSGKVIGLLFEKFSTRTRLSFESAISKLGAYPLFINKDDTQLSRGESIAETARMFSLYMDALIFRTNSHSKLIKFDDNSSIPVVNALSDFEHPTQIISDLYTIKEYFNKKALNKIKIVYVGDSNNIANSFAYAAMILKLNMVFCCPNKYNKSVKKILKNNPNIDITDNLIYASSNADVIYTDVWTSMGMEKENKVRLKDFRNFQINSKIMDNTNKKSVFMHCLPAHIDEEVTEEVISSKKSIVYKQAENKLYAAMSVIDYVLS
ncbi:MAG: ornithine carbamoyltransferase [Thermodesulfobacteriota bacterium]|nr:ornithine carbamoyltransferase [Thermodesulfobacteriota bacterium]|tara:strand:- start:4296 stop:5189 length:894 start_codon:yes stop_codon:yes gene_type:complete